MLTGRPIREDGVDANYPVSTETIGVNFAKRHGIQGTEAAALAKLRALGAVELVDGGNESDGRGGPFIYSGPILDEKLAVETPKAPTRPGTRQKCHSLSGSQQDGKWMLAQLSFTRLLGSERPRTEDTHEDRSSRPRGLDARPRARA